LRASAALSLLIAGLDAGSRIGTRCQGVNPLPFWHTIGVGSAGLVWATAAIGSTLATATLAAVIALTTLPTLPALTTFARGTRWARRARGCRWSSLNALGS
jgi:hypothetical protein